MTSAKRRLQIGACVWLLRNGLVWLLALPLYSAIASSPILHAPQGDRHLFSPGAETLVPLLVSRAEAIHALGPMLFVVAALFVAGATVVSSFVWIAIDYRVSLRDPTLWSSGRRLLAPFAAISLTTMLFVLFAIWIWWNSFPVLGALFEPWLGEQGTDLLQLAVVGCVAGALGLVFVLTDVLRAVLCVRDFSALEALHSAVELYQLTGLRITVRAAIPFLLALALTLVHVWSVSYFGWLAKNNGHALFAYIEGEVLVCLAIWLRLGWISWIRHTTPLLLSQLGGQPHRQPFGVEPRD